MTWKLYSRSRDFTRDLTSLSCYTFCHYINCSNNEFVLVSNILCVTLSDGFHDNSSTDISSTVRHFVYRHFVCRHFVYYCIPASSIVIHPTYVSENHCFYQLQLLFTL